MYECMVDSDEKWDEEVGGKVEWKKKMTRRRLEGRKM
jgi:hypothetical protein